MVLRSPAPCDAAGGTPLRLLERRQGRLTLLLVRHLLKALTQASYEALALDEMPFFTIENSGESSLLQSPNINMRAHRVDPGGVADDIDQPVERVQPAHEVVVLAVSARKKCGEVTKPDASQTLDATERAGRTRVVRADSIDEDLPQLAVLTPTGNRKSEHVPERKAEIVDQHFPSGFRMPLGRIERGQKVIEIAGRGVQIDLLCQALDQRIDFVPLLVDEPLCIRFDVLHFASRRN